MYFCSAELDFFVWNPWLSSCVQFCLSSILFWEQLWACQLVTVLKQKSVNMMLNVHRTTRLIRDGGKGGMEVGGRGRLYTYHYTVTTRMIPALRWAVMRAILMSHVIVRDKVTRQCPQTTTFEEKGELKQIWTKVPLLTRGHTARPNRLSKKTEKNTGALEHFCRIKKQGS